MTDDDANEVLPGYAEMTALRAKLAATEQELGWYQRAGHKAAADLDEARRRLAATEAKLADIQERLDCDQAILKGRTEKMNKAHAQLAATERALENERGWTRAFKEDAAKEIAKADALRSQLAATEEQLRRAREAAEAALAGGPCDCYECRDTVRKVIAALAAPATPAPAGMHAFGSCVEDFGDRPCRDCAEYALEAVGAPAVTTAARQRIVGSRPADGLRHDMACPAYDGGICDCRPPVPGTPPDERCSTCGHPQCTFGSAGHPPGFDEAIRAGERELAEQLKGPAVAAQRTEPAPPPTCAAECGNTIDRWTTMADGFATYGGGAVLRVYCTPACRDAGKPLHPAKPPPPEAEPFPDCRTCGGTERYYGADNELVGPCPDCRPTPGAPKP
jgi:hypothetical protein